MLLQNTLLTVAFFCLIVAFMNCIKTAKCTIKLYSYPIDLVFS